MPSLIEPTIGSLRFWTLTGRLGLNSGRMIETRRLSGLHRMARGVAHEIGPDHPVPPYTADAMLP